VQPWFSAWPSQFELSPLANTSLRGQHVRHAVQPVPLEANSGPVEHAPEFLSVSSGMLVQSGSRMLVQSGSRSAAQRQVAGGGQDELAIPLRTGWIVRQ
jgi:hypothetical protein